MSRGPGRVMRECLAVMAENPGPIDSHAIAAMVYDVRPDPSGRCLVTDAQVVAVRRAMVALVRAGKVADLGRGRCSPTSRRSYATPERAAVLDLRQRATFGSGHRPSDPIRPRGVGSHSMVAPAEPPPPRNSICDKIADSAQ